MKISYKNRLEMHFVNRQSSNIENIRTSMNHLVKKKHRPIKKDDEILNDTFREDRRQATSNTGHVWSWQIVCYYMYIRQNLKTKLKIHRENVHSGYMFKESIIFQNIFWKQEVNIIMSDVQGLTFYKDIKGWLFSTSHMRHMEKPADMNYFVSQKIYIKERDMVTISAKFYLLSKLFIIHKKCISNDQQKFKSQSQSYKKDTELKLIVLVNTARALFFFFFTVVQYTHILYM